MLAKTGIQYKKDPGQGGDANFDWAPAFAGATAEKMNKGGDDG